MVAQHAISLEAAKLGHGRESTLLCHKSSLGQRSARRRKVRRKTSPIVQTFDPQLMMSAVGLQASLYYQHSSSCCVSLVLYDYSRDEGRAPWHQISMLRLVHCQGTVELSLHDLFFIFASLFLDFSNKIINEMKISEEIQKQDEIKRLTHSSIGSEGTNSLGNYF